MSSPNWTLEQSDAIEARDCSLLVSAAAGSGKTAVLVERIIRRISDETEGVDVDKLLVVTFTKAAAAEMRERINSAIIKKLNQNPASRHLNRQLTLLNRASITTLHSFCLEILKQYFYRIDLDPGFRVAEDAEAELIRIEVLEDLFEECYTNGAEEFLALVDAYGGDRDDFYLQNMVLKLYEFSRSTPWPQDWLKGMAEGYRNPEGLPLGDTHWGQELISWIQLGALGCREKLEKALRLAGAPGGPEVYCQNLSDDIAIIDDIIRAARISWGDLYQTLNSVQFTKLNTCRSKDVDEILKKQVQTIRDHVKKTVNGLRTDYFSRSEEELTEDLAKVRPLVEELVTLVNEFSVRYQKAKTDRGLVDFSDLEHYCLQILLDAGSGSGKKVPSGVAAELREYFTEVFVDEYQDINEVQETILTLISRSGDSGSNMFMVGDVKQSIYGFRLADPSLFMKKYVTFPRDSGFFERGIDLRQNFRSRAEVLAAVNFIFRQVMTPRVGEITYDEKAELVCGAGYPQVTDGVVSAAGPVELHVLDKAQPDENPDLPVDGGNHSDYTSEGYDEEAVEASEELDVFQREARFIGRRIIGMVNGAKNSQTGEFYVFDRQQGGYRPVQYRDIVILLRSTRNTANVFIDEFRKLDIPAYADLGTGYFEAVEVETVMSLLKIIDNPRQDIPLAAVLRSPMVGLTADELAEVRLKDLPGQFYDAVKGSAESGENQVGLKLKVFLKHLEEWRTAARQGPLSELIWKLYNETGYYTYVGGMPGGAQRQANLRALYDRARQYESTSFKGLFRFLRFIDQFRDRGSDLGAARALGENENVVRIISIHKSKGLEFPVVIAAGLGKQFNFSDLRQKFLLHKKLGVGLPVVDANNCLSYQTLAQHAIKKRMLMELLAEEMRVLYVALTRAKEKLILVGSVRDLDKAAGSWCDSVLKDGWALPDYVLAEATNYLDWICPAVARHIDGLPLRETGKCAHTPCTDPGNDSARFNLQLHKIGAIPAETDIADHDISEFLEKIRRLEPIEINKGQFPVEQKLSWTYPLTGIVGLSAKATVSEIKRRFSAEDVEGADISATGRNSYVPRRPEFLVRSTTLSPAERGSAMHLVMQHLDFTRCLTEEEIREQVRMMESRELLTGPQAESIDISAVRQFFLTPLGERVRRAAGIKKEIPFIMSVPIEHLYNLDLDCSDHVMVQGVIDCLIDEGDGFVLVDYKTDSGNINDILSRYRGQLRLYAEAVEKILKKPVKEKYLYLFSFAQEVLVED